MSQGVLHVPGRDERAHPADARRPAREQRRDLQSRVGREDRRGEGTHARRAGERKAHRGAGRPLERGPSQHDRSPRRARASIARVPERHRRREAQLELLPGLSGDPQGREPPRYRRALLHVDPSRVRLRRARGAQADEPDLFVLLPEDPAGLRPLRHRLARPTRATRTGPRSARRTTVARRSASSAPRSRRSKGIFPAYRRRSIIPRRRRRAPSLTTPATSAGRASARNSKGSRSASGSRRRYPARFTPGASASS